MGRGKTLVGLQVAGDARTKHPVVISFLDGVYRCEGCGVEEEMDLAATVSAAMKMGDAFAVQHEGCRTRPVGRSAESLAEKHRFSLWDAIHAYVEACGGDTGRHHLQGRMGAVTRVERAVDKEVERKIRIATSGPPRDDGPGTLTRARYVLADATEAGPSTHRPHTTHHDDCGCRSERYEAELATLRAEVARLQHFRDEMCDGFDVPRDTSLEDLDAHISTVLRTALDTLKERDAEVARLTREAEKRAGHWRCLADERDAALREVKRLTRERDEARGVLAEIAELATPPTGMEQAMLGPVATAEIHALATGVSTLPETPDARDLDDVEQGTCDDCEGPVPALPGFSFCLGHLDPDSEDGIGERERELLRRMKWMHQQLARGEEWFARAADWATLWKREAKHLWKELDCLLAAHQNLTKDYRRVRQERDEAREQAVALAHGYATQQEMADAAYRRGVADSAGVVERLRAQWGRTADKDDGALARYGVLGVALEDIRDLTEPATPQQPEGDGFRRGVEAAAGVADREHDACEVSAETCRSGGLMDAATMAEERALVAARIADDIRNLLATPTEQPEASEECTCFGIHVPGDTECPAYVDTSELLREWEAQLTPTEPPQRGVGEARDARVRHVMDRWGGVLQRLADSDNPTDEPATPQQGEAVRCHGYCVEADGSECPGPCPPDGEGEEDEG